MTDIHVEHVARRRSCLCNSLLFERRNNMDEDSLTTMIPVSSRYRLAKKNKNTLYNYTSS